MPLSSPGKVPAERAERYDKYRLPYSERGVARMLDLIGQPVTVMADIGCGTGLVTTLFTDKADTIYAVDPEPAMVNVARRRFQGNPKVVVGEGYAEETGLASGSLDLIVVGNAYHRFDPEPTVKEFKRILKPGGWLALFGYGWEETGVNRALAEAMGKFEPLQARMKAGRHGKHPGFFFGSAQTVEIREPQSIGETWEQVWGGLSSGIESPGPEDDWYCQYKAALKEVFDRYENDGVINYRYSTNIMVGQPVY